MHTRERWFYTENEKNWQFLWKFINFMFLKNSVCKMKYNCGYIGNFKGFNGW
jgi:hypothetical protein